MEKLPVLKKLLVSGVFPITIYSQPTSVVALATVIYGVSRQAPRHISTPELSVSVCSEELTLH